MFGKSEYAVTIEVDPVRDKAAKEYTTKKIAEICTRAFGDSLKFKLLRGNHVSESDVLELKDYDSEYMDQSIYNRRSAGKDSSSATNESI